jgi:hypothetical protein
MVLYFIWSPVIEYNYAIYDRLYPSYKAVRNTNSINFLWKDRKSKKKTRRTFLIFGDPPVARFTIIPPR